MAGFRNNYRFLLFLFPLILCGFILIGCSDDDDDNNDTGPPMAQITIRSEPDPVPYDGDDGDYHIWRFTFYVEETAGVGATLTEWSYKMYNAAGELIGENSHPIDDFINWFNDCDNTGQYINPNGSRCTGFLFRSTSNEAGWSAMERMRFTDDNGHDFYVEGTFTFLPI